VSENDPKPPYSDGPFLLVATPEILDTVVPLNASALVSEWESMLDPVQALRDVGRVLFDKVTWVVRGEKFVKPGFTTVALMRVAVRDEELTSIFAASNSEVEWLDKGGFRVADAHVDTDAGGVRLAQWALPLLLGLAATSTAFVGVGMAGQWLGDRHKAFDEALEVHRSHKAGRVVPPYPWIEALYRPKENEFMKWQGYVAPPPEGKKRFMLPPG
jgi:hypothetical protein